MKIPADTAPRQGARLSRCGAVRTGAHRRQSDRLVWGSDWPHTNSARCLAVPAHDVAPALPIDDGRVLNLLPTWTADAQIRRQILVVNPARLYGFAPA